MFVYINVGGNQPGWVVALTFLLPLLLQSGLLGELAAWVLQLMSPSFWLGWDQDDRHQERAAGAASPPPPDGWQAHDAQQSYEAAERDEDDLPLWAELISVLIPMLMTLALMKLVMWARQTAWWRARFGAPRPPGGLRRRGAPPPPRATIDQVAAALQRMPTEVYATAAELEEMTVHDLKARMSKRRLVCDKALLEKRELIQRLTEQGGSSADSCTICCEDYASGDALRLLPCGHGFHIECIDKWFYSATDYSRPPACPLCNKELPLAALPQAAEPPAAAVGNSAATSGGLGAAAAAATAAAQ